MEKRNAKEFTITEAKKLVPSKDVRNAIKEQGEEEFWNKLTPREFASIFYNIETDWNKQIEMFKNILVWSDDEKTNTEIKYELEYRKKSWEKLLEPEEGFIYKLEAFYHSSKGWSPYKGEYDSWCTQTTDFQTALDYGKTLYKDRFFKFNIEKTRLVKSSEKSKIQDYDFLHYLGEADYIFDKNGKCITTDIYHESLYMELMEKASEKNEFRNAYVSFPYLFKKDDIVTLIKKDDFPWDEAEEARKANRIMWISERDKKRSSDMVNKSWYDMNVGVKWRDTSDFAESANDSVNFLWLQKIEPSEFCKELLTIDKEFTYRTVTIWQHHTGLPCKLCVAQDGLMKKDGVYRIGVYNNRERIVVPDILFAMSICDNPEVLTDKDKVIFTDSEITDIWYWIRNHKEDLMKMADEIETMPKSVFTYSRLR